MTQSEYDERIYDSKIPAYSRGFNFRRIAYAYLEPLADKIELKTPGYLNWVIAGGQTGPGAKPLHPDWVRSIRDQCLKYEIPFYFKQWGEWLPIDAITEDEVFPPNGPIGGRFRGKGYRLHTIDGASYYRLGKKSGNLLDGRKWEQFPEAKP